MKGLPLLVCALAPLCACSREKPTAAASSAHDLAVSQPSPMGDQLGTVRFTVTGNAAAQRHMERGLKLLHHMTYAEADQEFAAALAADPDCVMAYWGRAMTIIHPLWPDAPNETRLHAGWEFVRTAQEHGAPTPREAAYLATLATYFANGWERTEKERVIAADKAWAKLHAEYPDDLEAACFYALFHLAPARYLPKDGSYRTQLESGAIVEHILAEIPDHPGAQHYKIHAYDFPALAGRAVEVCGSYGTIAPQVPHALHMPTHIYTRRGQWAESIALNLRSADAALQLSANAGGLNVEYLHALDYAVYAYLQRGQYREAEAVRDKVLAFDGQYLPTNIAAGAFAFAAIPARCALEQQHWAEAARLEPRRPGSFPWDARFIAHESIVYFARAIGALRNGDATAASADIAAHAQLAAQIAAKFPKTYWDAQARTQQLAMQAWLAFAGGRSAEALPLMRDAAQIEATSDKEAVTPGEVLPAGELLGDMLVETQHFDEAVAAYETVLERSPNRFYSLHGVGHAAELAGDRTKAAEYYQRVVAVAVPDAPESARLQHAKAFLAAR